MSTLVTGATGLLGNNVVRALLEQGRAVRVLTRESSDPRPLEGLEVERVIGDARDEAAVRRAVEGVEEIVHSAAFLQIGKTRRELSRAVNVDGTRHLARAARAAGARLLHVSTVDTLGVGTADQLASETKQFGEKTATTYSVTKREAEQLVEEQIHDGLDAVIVHPVFMVGPWDWKPSSGRMLLAVAQRWTPLAPPGGHTVADVRDVSAGILAAMERAAAGEHFILGGHPISYFDFWKLCAEVTGSRGPVGRLGPLNRALAGAGGDAWARLTGREGDINSAAIRTASQWHYYSSEKAERELGYAVRPLREAVESAWSWFREYGYA